MKTNSRIIPAAFLFLFVFPLWVYSQDLEVGMKAGADLNYYSNWFEYQRGAYVKLENPMHGGFMLGLSATKMFSEYIGAQVELNFEQKGFIIKDEYQSMRLNISYLTLPLMARGNYSIGNFDVSALFGIYLGIAVGGNLKSYQNEELIDTKKIEFGSGSLSDNSETVGSPQGFKANRFDFGLVFGLQPCYRLGPGKVFLDIRYSMGFIDVNNPTKEQIENIEQLTSDHYSQCNRTLGISAGYSILIAELFGK